MRTLLQHGAVVNVFTGEVREENVLLEGERILGVGAYGPEDADLVRDIAGRYVCPGLMDGHIHIESSMLLPAEFARVCLPHGTTTVVTDPHEIANVCGAAGIQFMLAASQGIPMTVYLMLPSCVPSTAFDETGAVLTAEDLEPFYGEKRVLGLAEVMDYPGVVAGAPGVREKIARAKARGLAVNGHAPLLTGRDLDTYIAAGIGDDHECSSVEEAMERIRKGQWVMIRQGTAARNLGALLPLFDEPWAHRCLLVSDDKHPADLLGQGHIDGMIRLAAAAGKNPVTGIRMATIQAAQCFGLRDLGAVAPGYKADLLVLRDLAAMSVQDVYCSGKPVVEAGRLMDFPDPEIPAELQEPVYHAFHMDAVTAADFLVPGSGQRRCRVIRKLPGQLITEDWVTDLDLDRDNGVDLEGDILKIAVLERHRHTGHRGLGYIAGLGLKRGAIASSVAHDAHNLVVVGAPAADMAAAANRVRELGGGYVVVCDGAVLAELPLPVAGLMSDRPAAWVAEQNEALRACAQALGPEMDAEPFMALAFASLPVIPHVKMTTLGLVDVDQQKRLPLFVE